jgi:hypothetical protein
MILLNTNDFEDKLIYIVKKIEKNHQFLVDNLIETTIP